MDTHLEAMLSSVVPEEDGRYLPRGQLKDFDFRDPDQLLMWYMKSRHELARRLENLPDYPQRLPHGSGKLGDMYWFEFAVGKYIRVHHACTTRCVLRLGYDVKVVLALLSWIRNSESRYTRRYYPTLNYKGERMFIHLTSSGHFVFTREEKPGHTDRKELDIEGAMTLSTLNDLKDLLRSWVVVSELTADLREGEE